MTPTEDDELLLPFTENLTNLDQNSYRSTSTDYASLNSPDFRHHASISPNNRPSSITQNNSKKTLGMFFGVIVPCTLSMFSIVLFLRVGYLIGFAGLKGGILIICLSYFIIAMTVLSLCALCTNGKIEAGGAYYMISRTLGPEFGSSIGLMFFIANVASCALYIFGFIETLLANFSAETGNMAKILPEGYWWHFFYASVVLLICTSICTIGSSAYSKSVVFIFGLILTCLVSIFGSFFITNEKEIFTPSNANVSLKYTSFSYENWNSNNKLIWSDPENIDYISGNNVNMLIVFAVFFNGCIGVMAGVNVSGELIQPNKAIPKGTIIACGFTSVVYILLSLLIAMTCSHDLLISDYTILQKINFCPILIFIGVAFASVSAVLSNMIGASRVIYAIAKDRIFGKHSLFTNILTHEIGQGNPLGSVIFTFLLVQLFLLMGNLNAVAPIVTTFFLMAYAAVDGACLSLLVTSAPNFRPTFSYFNKYTCAIGLIGTLFMMFLVSPMFASLSCAIFSILFVSIHLVSHAIRSENAYAWGHISQAIIYHQVRKYLLKLDTRKDHIKYWRPQILVLHKNIHESACLRFANDLKKSGLLVVGYVLPKNNSDRYGAYPKKKIAEIGDWIDNLKLKSFLEVTRAYSVRDGSEQLLCLSGLGGMKPNTLMVGLPKPGRYDDDAPQQLTTINDEHQTIKSADEYISILCEAIELDKNVVIHNNTDQLIKHINGFIDVYPFMLMLSKEKSIYYSDLATCHPNEFENILDNSSLFLLQMACILSMNESYKSKKIKGRVVRGWFEFFNLHDKLL